MVGFLLALIMPRFRTIVSAFAALVLIPVSGPGRAATVPTLEVTMVDELDNKVEGFLASVELKDKRFGTGVTRTAALLDGPAKDRQPGDGKKDGVILFEKGPWAKMAAVGASAKLFVIAPGFWGSEQVMKLTAGAGAAHLTARYPLVVRAEKGLSPGFSLWLNDTQTATDGGPGDGDGKKDSVIHASVPHEWVIKSGMVEARATGPAGGEIARTRFGRNDTGWDWTLTKSGGRLAPRSFPK